MGIAENPLIVACQKILDRHKIKAGTESIAEPRALVWFMDFGVGEDYPDAFTFDMYGRNRKVLGYPAILEVGVEGMVYLMESIDFQKVEEGVKV